MTETINPKPILECVRAGNFYQVQRGNLTYGDVLMRMVDSGLVDAEVAHLAIVEGTEVEAERILMNIKIGHLDDSYTPDRTYRQRLREIIDDGFIDQDVAHKAIINGRKVLGLI